MNTWLAKFSRALGPIVVGAFAVTVPLSASAEKDRLAEMISPIINPVNFEDPRANSEVRFLYLYHAIQDDFVTNGGNAQLYAAQIRYAVNEDFAIIATKDGIIDLNPNEVIDSDVGFANLAGGVKYSVYRDNAAGRIATLGLEFEVPTGDDDVLQGEGDGILNPFFSGAVALGDVNLMTGAGLRIPMSDEDSFFFDYDLHASYPIGRFIPALEVSVIHVLDAGNRLPIADEGLDLFNFGASDSDGKTVVMGGVGARYRIADPLDAGVGYSFPMTSGRGSNLIDWRLTADLIWSFDKCF